MNVVYGNHQAYVEEDLGGSASHPFGGLLLSTGEAAGYDDPDLDVEPSDGAWADAHDPLWIEEGNVATCKTCGRRRAPSQL